MFEEESEILKQELFLSSVKPEFYKEKLQILMLKSLLETSKLMSKLGNSKTVLLSRDVNFKKTMESLINIPDFMKLYLELLAVSKSPSMNIITHAINIEVKLINRSVLVQLQQSMLKLMSTLEEPVIPLLTIYPLFMEPYQKKNTLITPIQESLDH